MSDTSQNPVSSIEQKAPKPPGLMPKNLQAMIIFGIALLMVLIMALTGHKRPNAAKTSGLPPLPAPLPVNQEKVTDFQKGIEQKQRESAPQVEAALLEEQRKQLAAQGQLTQANPYGTPVSTPYTNGMYPPGAYAAPTPQSTTAPVQPADAIKDEQKKREYLSLFADNVALTYRKGAAGPQTRTLASVPTGDQPTYAAPTATGVPNPSQAQDELFAQEGERLAREEQLLQQAQQAGLLAQAPLPRPVPSNAPGPKSVVDPPPGQEQAMGAKENPPNPDVPAPGAFNSAEGKKYVLFEGTVLETLLINRLDGTFAGPVSSLVTNDVYSHDRQHLLIPAGSKVLGEASKADTFGQARLAVAFHRLLMPDGYSVSLDQFKGLDPAGATALKDKVNNHYLKIFGASLAIGILGGAAQLGTGSVLTETGAERIQQGFGTGMAISAERIMDRFLNILPTVTIREGSRVKVYLSNDLLLPDYNSHTMPANL
jgi:type IV secretory pathway VirB10-like protein